MNDDPFSPENFKPISRPDEKIPVFESADDPEDDDELRLPISAPPGPAMPAYDYYGVPRDDERPPDVETEHHQPQDSKSPSSSDPQSCAELLPAARELFRRRRAKEETAIETPWPTYNQLLGGGFWPGCHILVGGTGVGKTQLAIQVGLKAARAGTPVTMIALELDSAQLLARLIGEIAGLSWSSLYLGNRDPSERRIVEAMKELEELPFYIEQGSAHGWSVDRLKDIALFHEHKNQETKGGLIILDFLQIIAPQEGKRVELRERIGQASYRARNIAREHGATVLLVSATAREKYKLLCDPKAAGIGDKHRLLAPEVLIGLAKEAGEVEFSADSVTVLVKGERLGEETGVYACVPKLRAGPPGWCGLKFKYRFEECPKLEAPKKASTQADQPSPKAEKASSKANGQPEDRRDVTDKY